MGIKVKERIMLHTVLFVFLSLVIDMSIVIMVDKTLAFTAAGFLLAHFAKISAAFIGAWQAKIKVSNINSAQ